MSEASPSLGRCERYDSGWCRSCSMLSLPREQELAMKTEQVLKTVAARLSPIPLVAPIFSPQQILPSRTKAKLQVSGEATQPTIGLVTLERKQVRAKELLDCPLHHPAINALLSALARELLPPLGIEPFDPAARSGELKGIIILANAAATEMILRFVCRSRTCESALRAAVPSIEKAFPAVRVVSMNLQPIPQAVLEGPEEIILTAEDSIVEQFDSFAVEYGPQSFKQVTHESAQALYARARDLAARRPVHSLLDLYCGSGAFTLALADNVQAAAGIEISEPAVRCATRQIKDRANVRFIAADADQAERWLFDAAPDLVVVNPPRRGLSRRLIGALLEASPDRLLYSSCNVDSLARDLKLLESGYRTAELHPFDMFPLTGHIEVLALLERR